LPFFGYDHKLFGNGLAVLFALPEKAIIDLLYLYPFYCTEDELINLRLDREVLDVILDVERLLHFTDQSSLLPVTGSLANISLKKC
jgi:hypothetical protein